MDMYEGRMSLPTSPPTAEVENSTIHRRKLENRITEVPEEDAESINETPVVSRFSVKKTEHKQPSSRWKKVAARLSKEKYKTVDQQKTMEPFLDDEDNEVIETAEEISSRFKKVVVQATVEDKKRNRFSIKSVPS